MRSGISIGGIDVGRRSDLTDEQRALVEFWFREGATLAQVQEDMWERWRFRMGFSSLSRWRAKALGGPVLEQRAWACPWQRLPGVGGRLNRKYSQVMLSRLASLEAGQELEAEASLEALRFRDRLELTGMVVDYDYESDTFVRVPRREGVDDWWIRDPFLADDGSLVPVGELPPLRESALSSWRERRLALGKPI